MQVLNIVRWCCIIQLKLDIGRKSKGQLSVFLFLFKSINSGFTTCKTAISGVKDGEVVLMDCDYPSWDLHIWESWLVFKELEVRMSFRSLFSNSEMIWRLVNTSHQISYAFAEAQIMSFGHLFVILLQQKWLGSLFGACVQQLLLSCRLCRWNFCQINLKYNYFFKLLRKGNTFSWISQTDGASQEAKLADLKN